MSISPTLLTLLQLILLQIQGPYGQAPLSINQILQAAFQILTYEKVSIVNQCTRKTRPI